MLTLYSIDWNNHFLIKYNYISDANAFMTYLPIAEKILDSMKILKWSNSCNSIGNPIEKWMNE
jgi:hypothetical protein